MTTRADADGCPGVLRPHQAVDGAVLRVRIPGGRIAGAALRALSAASTEYADGDIQLTSRANLQLRGVRTVGDGLAPTGLAVSLAGAGLLPHPTHERARNILCSPLTGLVGGLADLRRLVGDLDVGLCAGPDLADLPGPFLFALDDGRGDVGVDRADLAAVAVGGDRVRICAGGLAGPSVPLGEAVPTLLDLARRFLAARPADRPVWHVRELPQAGRELIPLAAATVAAAGAAPPLGSIVQHDGRVVVSALAPLGRLTAPQVAALARAATGSGLIVTPWRGVLVPDLLPGSPAVDQLAAAGLDVDTESPWRGVTACPGTRCVRGTGDTDALARQIVAASPRSAQLPVHVVACPRACGRPWRPHVLATVDRERVEIHGSERSPGIVLDRAAGMIVGERVASAR